MRIKITELTKLINKDLKRLGFSTEDVKHITKNLIEAELSNKQTHGVQSFFAIQEFCKKGLINIKNSSPKLLRESNSHIHYDALRKSGYSVIYPSLKFAYKKIKKSGLLIFGIKNISYSPGFIGAYARETTEKNLIFIGFTKSPKTLIPFGAKRPLLGTNPLTIGVPSEKGPIILDFATSEITWNEVLTAFFNKQTLENGVIADKEGNITNDPSLAIQGGVLPIAKHKGSGLSFIIEILASILPNSSSKDNLWSFLGILIDPVLFGNVQNFKKRAEILIKQLKHLPKKTDVKEIYYPGEQSQKTRKKNLKKGWIDIDAQIYKRLVQIINY